MPKSYRIRTKLGVDQNIQLKIEQDFDFLEILSLKLRQEDLYADFCADYGVVVGRVVANSGYGVPNARVSVFVPVETMDLSNPIISSLYPYKTPVEKNEDGYRYNLLPYNQEYGGHTPTGTFPTREDVLTRNEVLEIYEKYYKYTVKTNDSGDFMIVGVPLGDQQLVMDLDLSNMGCFSLRPQDLIRMNMGVEEQFDGTNFKSSENLATLPQIINSVKTIDVASFWGQEDLCNIGITRSDFDLRDLGIEIEPTAVFMGSIFSSNDSEMLKKNCKPKIKQGGLCNLVTGPGEIIAVRQTTGIDENDDPILEQYNLGSGGKVIDSDGAFVADVPMNLDYVVTNEFGEQVISQDTGVGVPTGGKYRFKIKYQSDENGQALNKDQIFSIKGDIIRANFLVPQIREYGWTGTTVTPGTPPEDYKNDTFDYLVSFTSSNPTETKNIPISAGVNGKTVRIKSANGGVESYEVFINGVKQINRWMDFKTSGTITITVKKTQTPTVFPGDVILEIYDYNYMQFQRSYGMSLDWSDYADKDAAINCEDFFYPMKYNKVYTTAQLIDGYRRGTSRGRFMGIKEVLNDECATEVNKFPVNDGVKNFDFIFFLASIFLIIIPRLLFPLVIIGHVICLLWPIIKAISNFVYKVLGTIINAIIFVINLFIKKSKELSKINTDENPIKGDCPLSAISLPNLSYPDCSACDCAEVDAGQNTDTVPTVEIDGNYSQLADTTTPYFFSNLERVPNGTNWNDAYALGMGMVMSGWDEKNTRDEVYAKTPYTDADWNQYPDVMFSNDLPMSEKFNLFNAKAKYHEQDGFNKIGVSVNPSLPANNGKSHTDNVIMMVMDSSSLSSYSPGSIVTFQNIENSKDPNVSGATSGTTSFNNGIANINITYMDSSLNTQQVVYEITGTDGDLKYNFPSDVEYYQVITGQTLFDYSASEGNTSNAQQYMDSYNNSLASRYLFGWQHVHKPDTAGNVSGDPDDYPDGSSPSIDANPTNFVERVPNIQLNPDWKDLTVVFLVRGVDPNTPRQDIEYDLSRLYGKTMGTSGYQVRGQYKLNVPIQPYASSNNWGVVKHNKIYTNDGTDNGLSLFYKSFTFTANTSQYVNYKTENHLDYSAYNEDNNENWNGLNGIVKNMGLSDSVNNKGVVRVEHAGSWYKFISDTTNTTTVVDNYRWGYHPGEIVDGVGAMFANVNTIAANTTSGKGGFAYYSPTYYNLTPGGTIDMDNNEYMVMRSDSLPTSDIHDGRFVLHQNSNFATYVVNDEGQVTVSTAFPNPAVGDDNADDFAESTGVVGTKVVETFSCNGMVPLKCYSGNGENIGVKPLDDECYYNGKVSKDIKIMEGGCYYLITRNMTGIVDDFKSINEWAARFRLTFGICRNVMSLTFVNNWVNGGLYMYSFQKDDIYKNPLSGTTFNSAPTYQYCDDTIVYQDVNNAFYYRATPYNPNNVAQDNLGFTGKLAPTTTKVLGFGGKSYTAGNLRTLGNPTTIMDLGPRDQFIKEICYNPDYQGYIVDSIKSTSYKDTSDIIQLMIISRLSNSSFLENLTGLGDGGINKLFSRTKDRLDGDITQLLSINSEFGVTPFLGSNYSDNQIAYLDNDDSNGKLQPVVGIFFSANTINRDLISPGRQTFQDNTAVGFLENTYSFRDQKIPYRAWETQVGDPKSIFGTQLNDWLDIKEVTVKAVPGYQSIDRLNGLPTFPSDTSTPTTQIPGFIYNSEIINDQITLKNDGYSGPLLVGAPYHFYFGLKVGKSSMNKFIDKYVLTTDIL